MPWIPVQDGLKRLRESRGWSIADLVEACDVSKRQTEQIESKTKPPSFIKPATVDAICQAFGLDLREWESWSARDRWVVWEPHTRRPADDSAALSLGVVGTIDGRAKMERDLKLHDLSVETARGQLPLLGLDWMSKVLTKPKLYEGKAFVVSGVVHQHSRMPSSTASVLRSDPEQGVIFRISRMVAKRLPQYVTIYAIRDAESDQLLGLHATTTRVTMIVRLFYAPPDGPWRGFMGYDGHSLTPGKKFAYVVDEIVSIGAESAPDRPDRRRKSARR